MATPASTKSKLFELLDPKLVLFLRAGSRDEAIDTLVDRLDQEGRLPDPDAFKRAILEREELVSTGIGLGIAIPHAKLSHFSSFFIAVGIQQEVGIEWHSLDRLPVRLIFMIGGPTDQQTEYLQILSLLTGAIRDPEIRKRLLLAHTPQEGYEIMTSQ